MKVAVATWSSRKVGGIETYLDRVICQIRLRGHEIALWHEMDRPEDRKRILLPDGMQTWCVEQSGVDAALQGLREWQPDVIYAHGLLDTVLEAALTSAAPVFFFAHQYHGTCVGGPKTWKHPRPKPCSRVFGRQCLLHYYPHRCGGWHPLTMLREYKKQKQRLEALRFCRGIVTHTEHMRREYLRHVFPPKRVHKIPFPVPAPDGSTQDSSNEQRAPGLPAKLLFLGRMDELKGGTYLIGAAAKAGALLSRPIEVTLAGDGPNRSAWQRAASFAEENDSGLTFAFPGWVSDAERDRLLQNADLLVVPSLWPEPFGMVGIEAGHFGVPSVAYAVGGIPEWLLDGKNGHLAPGDPPTKQGLASAIHECLADPAHYRALCDGAVNLSRGYTIDRHLDALLELFEQAVEGGSDS